jgi:hypothetical protein
MGDAIKNRVAQELAKFITEHELWQLVVWIAIVAIIFFGAGAILGFFYKRQKHYAELEKTSAELVAARFDAALKRQESRRVHTRIAELLALHLRSWFEVGANGTTDEINAVREEALRLFDSEYIPTFADYSELQFASLTKAEKRSFAEEDVTPFLETVGGFLDGVNYRPVLDRLDREPFKLKKTTLRRIYRDYRRAVPWWRCTERRKFKQACESIGVHERE